MDLTLLSGVVRNRKVMVHAVSRSQALFEGDQADIQASHNTIERLRSYLTKNSIFKKFSLRVHKFAFQWELAIHFLVCILSLAPFFFTGRRLFSLIPISVWLFYNVLFLIGPQHSNKLIPRFGRIKNSFKNNIEEFFSPKLLPVLSISFLCVVLSLAVTGHRLGGPPLCYHPCGTCLATWQHSIILTPAAAALLAKVDPAFVPRVDPLVSAPISPLDAPYLYDPLVGRVDPLVDAYRVGCGYANGKELLGYYTMAQTSFLLFIVVVVAVTVCLAWRVADEEKSERRQAEEWLKRDALKSYEMRQTLIEKYGSPGSSVRPEGSAVWVYFGVTAALTFTLLGWHNWYVLPPSNTATLLIILNLLTILMSTLILHLSFFGRLLALYKRNFYRVECLTQLLSNTDKDELDSWWNCRNFVLNDDLSLDYDIGGLAVSATFLIALLLFGALITQLVREGLQGMLEPPGSYLAYACLYITCCLIKLFTLATNTYEEQHRHIAALQTISNSLQHQGALSTDYNEFLEYKGGVNGASGGGGGGGVGRHHATPWLRNSSEDDYQGLADDGPLLIDDEDSELGSSYNTNTSGTNASAHSASHANVHGVHTTHSYNYSTSPNNIENMRLTPPGSPDRVRRDTSGGSGMGSNTNSPRKVRGKSSFHIGSLNTAVNSDDSGPASPVDKRHSNTTNTNSANTNNKNTMSNWLGKNIFGSFKADHSVSNNNSTYDEHQALLNQGTANIGTVGGANHKDNFGLDISVIEQGGNTGSDSGNNSPTTGANNASTAKLPGLSLQLPRPHAGTASAVGGKNLNIDTEPEEAPSTTNPNIVKLSPLYDNNAFTPFSPLLPLTYSHGDSVGPVDTSVYTGHSTSHNTSSFMAHNPVHAVHAVNAAHSTHSTHSTHPTHTHPTHTHTTHTSNTAPSKPVLTRSVSHNASMESYRQTIAEIISQIRRYDPYPCILGIPVMPALFNSSKFYIFIMFSLLGIRTMIACLRQL